MIPTSSASTPFTPTPRPASSDGTRRRRRGGALPAHQALGRLPQRVDPLLPGSRDRAGRRGSCRGQQRQRAPTAGEARLCAALGRRARATCIERLRHRGDRADVAGSSQRASAGRGVQRHRPRGRAPPRHLASAFSVALRGGDLPCRSTASATSPRPLGLGQGGTLIGRRPRLLPALAGHVLQGDHPVHRLPALRRRVQGDGPRALRRAGLRRRR